MVNYIIGFIQRVRIADLIDIGIIAIFIYLVLVWLKKARARFMLLGMIILGSVYALARLLGLYLTTTVFQAFFAIFLIIIVIIFQDDFRRFFERIAIWGISRRHIRAVSFGQDQDIEILSSALANLSRKQIGALVVIRGGDPLDRHLEAGINLDGLLSQVLLESIFDPHVPSHDGAVIVDGGRITRFGCYLPLSTNVQEIGRLGTRHAAALGLAERTDALCIVISEEYGTISVAERGRIRRLSDVTALNGILADFYRERFPRKKRIILTDFLTGHSLEKIIAVILACSLWLVFGHRTELIRRDFIIPIEYRNLASDRIISEPKPKEVTITLSGSERTFNLLEPKELKLSLDMSEVKDEENKFLLNKDMVRYPAGLSMVNIEPEEIKLRVYKMIPLSIPVELKTDGRPSSDVIIREIKVEPKQVSVVVPSTLPKDEITVTTETIDLKSISETTTLIPKIKVTPDVRFLGDKYPEVKVTIEVEKKGGP